MVGWLFVGSHCLTVLLARGTPTKLKAKCWLPSAAESLRSLTLRWMSHIANDDFEFSESRTGERQVQSHAALGLLFQRTSYALIACSQMPH